MVREKYIHDREKLIKNFKFINSKKYKIKIKTNFNRTKFSIILFYILQVKAPHHHT